MEQPRLDRRHDQRAPERDAEMDCQRSAAAMLLFNELRLLAVYLL